MAEYIKVPAGVYDMVTRCMEQEFPDHVAIRYVAEDGKTVVEKKYREYAQDIRRMTAYLKAEVPDIKGRRIVLLSRNCYEFCVASYGIILAGGVLVTLNQKKTWEELEYELGLVEPTLILNDGIDYGCRAELEAAYGPKLRPMDCYKETAPGELTNCVGHDDLMMLMFTSGTTGRSKGVMLNDAGPSTPVEITGLTAVPEAGDLFEAVEDERLARELAEQRIAAAKEKQFSAFQKVTLDNLFSQMAQNDMKELAIVVKADVQGSAEAVKQSLEKISNDEVRVRVIHAGVGAISKSDVDLADASNAIIIGFNVRPDNVAKEEAAATKVEMRMYRVIYDAINDVTDAMKGMLAPKFREVSLGELQVRQVYKISNVGTVAGCRVTSGKITRDSKVRVVRDGIVITEDEIASLKRFKDDAKEVAEGYECGVTLAKFADVKEGDVYEAFKMEEYRD